MFSFQFANGMNEWDAYVNVLDWNFCGLAQTNEIPELANGASRPIDRAGFSTGQTLALGKLSICLGPPFAWGRQFGENKKW